MKFQKGQSGNPAGKAPGTRHQVSVWAESVMREGVEKTLGVLMQKVEEGDLGAIKMVMDRICPVRKAPPFAMPENLTDKAAMLRVIMAAVADGDLTPGEALDTILSRSMEKSPEVDAGKLAATMMRAKETPRAE
jgi:hypothetical protein